MLRRLSALHRNSGREGKLATGKRPRLLAIASGGGHWEQLMLVRDAFVDADVTYATTMPGLAARSGLTSYLVPDCNRDERWKAARCVMTLVWLMIRVRPQTVVTTGALPGFIALAVGRRMGARTLWLDSVANAEEMSMAGLKARDHADRWLTQWPAVAQTTGAEYHGSVL